MANYMLAIPTIRGFCEHIHVSTGLVGVIAGASDFASMFMTPGEARLTWHCLLLLLPCYQRSIFHMIKHMYA